MHTREVAVLFSACMLRTSMANERETMQNARTHQLLRFLLRKTHATHSPPFTAIVAEAYHDFWEVGSDEMPVERPLTSCRKKEVREGAGFVLGTPT